MDPLSAVSLAACVVQFTDFGTRLISETTKVYRGLSGATARIVELSNIYHDLSQLCQAIDEKLTLLSGANRPPTASGASLVSACHRCKAAGVRVRQSVAKLQAKGTTKIDFEAELPKDSYGKIRIRPEDRSNFQSFRTALILMWSKNQVDGLLRDLADIRSGLMMAMIANLWYVH
ncbi:hypothetical protein BGZ61DRAFT_459840 [Ilyonectria robusta]|uniref:uncharacterized protein n=1 Tax=Ilyonectria robusta TaxID=1079257 RepID=UPI001E8D3D47|nr:uncharacterized protein BGZ61DRAFT_459840 [Ilyonectria robusta]KAH8670738.1 hypothetical protein BGZ61DRAFT_459840 [Ilyonectria robusta]